MFLIPIFPEGVGVFFDIFPMGWGGGGAPWLRLWMRGLLDYCTVGCSNNRIELKKVN